LERWMVAFPVLIIVVFAIAMCFEATQDYAFALVKENNVVEWLTFAAALSGGVAGLKLAIRAGQRRKTWVIWAFLFGFCARFDFRRRRGSRLGPGFLPISNSEFFPKMERAGRRHSSQFRGMERKEPFPAAWLWRGRADRPARLGKRTVSRYCAADGAAALVLGDCGEECARLLCGILSAGSRCRLLSSLNYLKWWSCWWRWPEQSTFG
jgi:hypothetical protein